MSHVHDMQPNRPVLPTFYRCTSCAFKCAPAALGIVERNPRDHHAVKATEPQARQIWGQTT